MEVSRILIKKNPGDFALWIFKAGSHSNALQVWESPFSSELVDGGIGFPGWHIECSAMALKAIGNTVDIHIGGVDHIPIHHTNEIAQSESATGVKFVNYWMHHEHILVNNQKMAKSEGTVLMVDDIIEKGFSPLDLRMLYLQAHYRSKQNFTWDSLKSAQIARNKIISRISSTLNKGVIIEKYRQDFSGAITDDWNFPVALSILFTLLNSDEKEEDIKSTILYFDQVLMLNLEKDIAQNNTDDRYDSLPDNIKLLVDKRIEAKQSKDFASSDSLREEINKQGYDMIDLPDSKFSYKKI